MSIPPDIVDDLFGAAANCAENGVAIMLTLFAVCRLFPLVRTWRTVNASGRSIMFNAAWIAGYAIGLSQFAVTTGDGWIGYYTAQIYILNALLVFIDLCLIAAISRGERSLRALT